MLRARLIAPLRHVGLAGISVGLLVACSRAPVQQAPEPILMPPDTIVLVDTVVQMAEMRELQRRVAALDLQMLEKDAQIAGLQRRLEEAIREVVRSMARAQSLATRAEAAAALAEAEVAVQAMQGRDPAGATQARRMLALGQTEFTDRNYGGAVYLAAQVKDAARDPRAGAAPQAAQPGEVKFAVPVPLIVGTRSNVRDGPGTTFAVVATLEKGTAVTGLAYLEEWVRIRDADGREGWMFRALLEGQPPSR